MTTDSQQVQERLAAYATKHPDGGVSVDLFAVLVDVCAMMKEAGRDKDEFLSRVSDLWDDIHIEHARQQ